MASPEFIDYLKTINSTFYDQIKAADQKAAYILTFLFVLLIWSSDMRQVFFWVNVDKGLSARWVLSLLQVLSLAVALVCAILVLLPRDAHGGVALYWNAWPHAREVVAKAMQADDRGPSDGVEEAVVEHGSAVGKGIPECTGSCARATPGARRSRKTRQPGCG